MKRHLARDVKSLLDDDEDDDWELMQLIDQKACITLMG